MFYSPFAFGYVGNSNESRKQAVQFWKNLQVVMTFSFCFLASNLRENSDLNISHFYLPSFCLHMGHACWVVVGASVDGQWQEWSSWSDCSVTCANGTQQRTRQCSAAAHGGSECRGHWAESRECHNPDCTGKILSLLIIYPL